MANERGVYKRRTVAAVADFRHSDLIQAIEDYELAEYQARVCLSTGRIMPAEPSIRRAPPDPGAEAQAKRIADWIAAHA